MQPTRHPHGRVPRQPSSLQPYPSMTRSSKVPPWLQPSHSARESQARLSIHITLIEGCVPVRTLKWLYNSQKKTANYFSKHNRHQLLDVQGPLLGEPANKNTENVGQRGVCSNFSCHKCCLRLQCPRWNAFVHTIQQRATKEVELKQPLPKKKIRHSEISFKDC